MLFALTEFVFEASLWVLRGTWSMGSWMIWGHQPTPGEIALDALGRLEQLEFHPDTVAERLIEIEKTQTQILELLSQLSAEHHSIVQPQQDGTTATQATTQSYDA
jgi:hypothetical protein